MTNWVRALKYKLFPLSQIGVLGKVACISSPPSPGLIRGHGGWGQYGAGERGGDDGGYLLKY